MLSLLFREIFCLVFRFGAILCKEEMRELILLFTTVLLVC